MSSTTEIAPFAGDMEEHDRRHAIALWKHAQQLAKSSLSGELRGKPEDVYAVVAFADQFGISAGNAIQMVWIIKGRIVPRSEFLSAICRRNGHELRFEESSSERCTVAIRRRGDDFWQRITFTIEDAQRAGLAGKDIWKQFPGDMLCHATVRRAVKRICPDVLLGVDLGGDEGIDARQYRPLDGDHADRVVDVTLDWDDEPEPQPAVDPETGEVIEDAEVVDDPPAPDEEPTPDSAEHEQAMRRLMVTCGKAFPETDAAKGKKTHRQRILRHAAQHVFLKEHRSAKDLTVDELVHVEASIHRYFVDKATVTPMRYEILDDSDTWRVKFTLGDKAQIVEAPTAEPAAA